MNPTKYKIAIIIATFCFISCNGNQKVEESAEPVNPYCNEPDAPVWTMNSDKVDLGTADFLTFDIERDYTPMKENYWGDAKKKKYVENLSFNDTVNITFNGSQASINCSSPSVTAQADGAHVTVIPSKNVICFLTGKSTDGSLTIAGDGQVCVNLNGADIKNTNGPAIFSHSKKSCYVVCDSASVLSDNATYVQANDTLRAKGCVYARGKLLFSGKSPLKIIAGGADAIHSGKSVFVRRNCNIDIESHAGTALKEHTVKIEGGIININQTGSGGSGIAGKRRVKIDGGRTTIISNTGLAWNGKCSRGIKSDSLVAITGGTVRIKDSSPGCKGIRSGHAVDIKNSVVDVITLGDDRGNGNKNRGISGADELKIENARVRVRADRGRSEGACTFFRGKHTT